MMSNLLFYRFIILNILALAIVAALGWSGYLLPLFVTDESRLTIVIAALFLIGWVWSWKEAVTLSMALNDSKRRGPQPACDALRDKAVAKTEWLGSVSEWLVALGLLGTVIGFSMALAGIDQGTVATATGAQSAVTALMQGMRVALNTTLVGAALALWHEVNIRMLKTALTIYWADRVAVWQAALSLPIGYPVATKVQHRPNGGVPRSASVVEASSQLL